jgi:hypothetical protein
MELLILLMLIALIPAYIARSKGRSLFAWWIYGVLLFIIALPHALLLSKRKSLDDLPDRRPCPYCAESIKAAANLCPFCKKTVSPILYN